MKKTIVAIIVGILLIVGFYSWLACNRYHIVTNSRGIAYVLDKATGNTWFMHGKTKGAHEKKIRTIAPKPKVKPDVKVKQPDA